MSIYVIVKVIYIMRMKVVIRYVIHRHEADGAIQSRMIYHVLLLSFPSIQ